MKNLLSLVLILAISGSLTGQISDPKDKFELAFNKKKNEGQFLYKGSAHSFSIDFDADEIQTTQNANFVIVNKQIVQTSSKPLKDSSLNFSSLSTDQQKTLLGKYVDNELEYVNNELKMYSRNLKKEWVTIKSKIWLVWSFDIDNLNTDEPASLRIKKQIYASTICFNQVLNLNTPIFQNTDPAEARKLLTKMIPGLKMDNKRP